MTRDRDTCFLIAMATLNTTCVQLQRMAGVCGLAAAAPSRVGRSAHYAHNLIHAPPPRRSVRLLTNTWRCRWGGAATNIRAGGGVRQGGAAERHVRRLAGPLHVTALRQRCYYIPRALCAGRRLTVQSGREERKRW